MQFLNMSDTTISQLSLEALRLTESDDVTITNIIPSFDVRALPIDAELITSYIDNIPDKLIPVLEYIASRKLCLDDYPFYWTPRIGFNNRVIIPFFFQNQIVGYTARVINSNTNPRYLSEQQPGYVFNLDRQDYTREFVIVCEGPFDAISIDGCALLGSEIKDSQNWLLKQLNKQIVLVPDRDKVGATTVEHAIELGWAVSMPDWPDNIKDINDAVVKLGRLTALWLIKQSIETYPLKIRLRAKKWFRE